MASETAALPTDPTPTSAFLTEEEDEQFRRFHAVCRRDLTMLAGVDTSWFGRRVLQVGLGVQVRQFAEAMAAFNADLSGHGLAPAARAICARYGGQVVAEGAEQVPDSGPVIFAANHPGLFDTLAIYATVPRADIRALARPQPLLTLLTALAPNLLMLPDEGPGRAGGLRTVLQTLRAGGALLVFPAGNLEPEPALLELHGSGPAPMEPLGAWSTGIGTLVKLAVRQGVPLRVVPTSIEGVLSTRTAHWFRPLLRLRRTARGREDLVALLQLAFPRLGPTTVCVRYGAPLDAATLAADHAAAEAITARIRAAVRAQLG